jgi:hypothetical protein
MEPTPAPDANAVIDSAAGSLASDLLDIGVTVLPYAATVVAIGLSWTLALKYVIPFK